MRTLPFRLDQLLEPQSFFITIRIDFPMHDCLTPRRLRQTLVSILYSVLLQRSDPASIWWALKCLTR